MPTASSHKKCLKSKRDKMLLKTKYILLEKMFTKLSKKGRKETVHKQVIIYFYEYILRPEYSQEYEE